VTQPPNPQPGWWQPPSGRAPQWQPPSEPVPQWQPRQQGYPPPQPQGYPAPQPYPGFAPGYGQPGATYGGFGAFGEGTSPKRKRSKKPWIIGAVVVVVLAAGGVGAWQLGAFRGAVLDRKSVEDGVQKVLHEDYGEGDIRNVNCPAGQAVKTGTTFECTVTVAGQPKKVSVRVLNDQAQFEVGAPK
jgi:hypothetical protein